MAVTTKHLLDEWKKKLLDLSKRNALMNFRATKRGTLQIIYPEFKLLFEDIINEKPFTFAKPNAEQQFLDFDPNIQVKRSFNIKSSKEELGEEISTLRNLRRRAKTITEEQGINTLHLTFGLLKWKENDTDKDVYSSPLILVPVTLNIASVVSPYVLDLQDDDVIVNPTLKYKLEHDFNISLPEFDPDEGIEEYIKRCSKLIRGKSGWEIETSTYLSIFSYLKINMYNDLSVNEGDVCDNDIVNALAGNLEALPDSNQIIEEVENLNFDCDIHPHDVFQVLDADSSQQEAIELAKRGVSFVLQGPPGTGKSQTITNIIAECLACGKKVLFVSEKEAALDVVKNRLSQTGIMDFCLAMHSHKANKKEIINELYRTASLDKKRLKDEYLAQLEKLYDNRIRLDKISDEIHKVIAPLNKTVFEVNGELATLEDAPVYVFDIPNVENYSYSQLDKVFEAIKLLTKAVEAFNGDRFTPLWGDCNLSLLSNQNKHDFYARINKNTSASFGTIINSIYSILGKDALVSWKELDSFVEMLEFCAKGNPIPKSWQNANLSELSLLAENWKLNKEQILSSESVVKNTFKNGITSFDATEFNSLIDGFSEFVSSHTQYQIPNPCSDAFFESLHLFEQNALDVANFIDGILDIDNELSELKLDLVLRRIDELNVILQHLNNLQQIENINYKWFEKGAIGTIKSIISDANTIFASNKTVKESLSLRFDDAIFSLETNELLPRFRAEYKSIFRIFNPSYKKDILKLRGLEKSGKLNYSEALDTLNKIKFIQDNEKTLELNANAYKEYFGICHLTSSDDLKKYSDASERIEKLLEFYQYSIPESVQQFIISTNSHSSEFKETIDRFAELCNDQTKISFAIKFKGVQGNLSIKKIKNAVEAACEFTDRIDSGIAYLNSYAHSALTNLNSLRELQEWEEYLKNLSTYKDTLYKSFEFFFCGHNTDWDKILKSIEWFRTYKTYERTLALPLRFTTSLVESQEIINDCSIKAETIKTTKQEISENIEWFNTWFPANSSILSDDLRNTKRIIDFYINNIENLDEWLSIRRSLIECKQLNIEPFIDTVVSNQYVNCADYLNIFKKRFYGMWLDKIMPTLPNIFRLSKVELNSLMDNFRAQDTDQFQIARLRIYQFLSEQLPNLSITSGASDQMGILRREYNKKRRQLPLRKLFNQIPSLVQKIKPCLMMSPLSVSLFLQNKDYHFDVVVFDEASQIKPENAIGSIIRGSQIIVAGDTRQLPPTTFFEKSNSDEDLYDSEDQDNEDYSLEESILDAAANILPEKYLKWHYRSRHEHLIAFSNVKIYDNRLTTFPSAIDKVTDNGVEFVYVKDGIYDRSGRRNNPKEAQTVADLVFKHFRNHPDRSLGIISNSEAQARAIEDIILKKRSENQQFEEFFSEERIEPFFIKSLESVQGDERDTIIFSIGYGKDANGKMYNTFGPINLDGGERRLNVAVTRAKYNLKLVSSIKAEDISISENTKKGPRLLKSYIDFANRGLEALYSEISDGNGGGFDSPFEESVYEFLVEKGYQVETQVGCAGYRIDLGIKDPSNPGRYILAVECDGATYHSSKYARERDRLRQSVLENIGWKFYRIWSTEWVNHPAQEKKLLCENIDIALHDKTEDTTTSKPQSQIGNIEELTEIVAEEFDDNLFSNGFDFEPYTEVDHTVWEYRYRHERIDKILSMEAPMHMEFLCRKYAPHMGREKVTSVVRSDVDYSIRHELSGKYVIENKFVYTVPKQTSYKMREVAERDISLICPEELQDLMLQVVRKSVGATKDSIISGTGHALGYVHCKERIINILAEIYQSLIESNVLSETPSGSVKIV